MRAAATSRPITALPPTPIPTAGCRWWANPVKRISWPLLPYPAANHLAEAPIALPGVGGNYKLKERKGFER
jgi:hypothetical protein